MLIKALSNLYLKQSFPQKPLTTSFGRSISVSLKNIPSKSKQKDKTSQHPQTIDPLEIGLTDLTSKNITAKESENSLLDLIAKRFLSPVSSKREDSNNK
jgi:hypothetical protein